MVKDILAQGYSLTYKTLCASNYGIPTTRRRLILLAAAPGNELPRWPQPTTDNPVTLRDAIRDLQWRNPRHGPHRKKGYNARSDYCDLPKQTRRDERPSSYARKLGAGCSTLITHHNTGVKPRMNNWDLAKTLPDWNEPLPST